MRQLAIDTATMSMSLALMEDDRCVAEVTTNTKIKHSTQLLPLLETLFQTVSWQATQLDAIIVTRGPGSYTGLRIGVTTAKTLAWTLNIPLYSVSSLRALAENNQGNTHYVASLINARRQTVFATLYSYDGQQYIEQVPEGHYTIDAFLEQVKTVIEKDATCLFVTPDRALFEEVINNAFGIRGKFVSNGEENIQAKRLLQIPLKNEDVHTFVPVYAKLAEAEENWQATHQEEAAQKAGHYVERAY